MKCHFMYFVLDIGPLTPLSVSDITILVYILRRANLTRVHM